MKPTVLNIFNTTKPHLQSLPICLYLVESALCIHQEASTVAVCPLSDSMLTLTVTSFKNSNNVLMPIPKCKPDKKLCPHGVISMCSKLFVNELILFMPLHHGVLIVRIFVFCVSKYLPQTYHKCC
jgi:hypothetical protein